MPALRLVAPQGRPLVLCLRAPLEHVRYRGCLPRLPPPMDFDAVPQVRRVVAAFGLVYEMTCWWRSTGRWPISSESEAFLRLQIGSKPRTAATTETKGYARAFRRAFDSQPRGRSGSGKFPESPRRGLYPCRERACIANLWQINPVSPWEALPDYFSRKALVIVCPRG
jgi:hypothetical protein